VAFEQLVAKNGYEATSVLDVAKEAGLSSGGLVLYHFKTKLDLLSALLEKLAEEADARLTFVLDDTIRQTPEDDVEAFVNAFLEVRNPPRHVDVACWVALSAEAVRLKQIRTRYAEVMAHLTARLEELVLPALPKGSSQEARRLACAVMAAIQGYFVLAATSPGLVPPGSAAPSVTSMALALLAEIRNPKRKG
jgi:TetR/AcrR family transcriptional repressor of bet genes